MKYYLKSFTKLVVITIFALLVFAGCVSRPQNVIGNNTNVNQDLAKLQSWQLSGKIAWITPEERKSAYINWQTKNNESVFSLNNLLGVNLASLRTENSVSTLSANDQNFVGNSASMLIYQQTGFRVPIEQLKFWVKGQIPDESLSHSSLSNNISYRPDGLVESVKFDCEFCDVWNIQYNSYTQAKIYQSTYLLPTSIELYNPAYQARIKIRINNWSE